MEESALKKRDCSCFAVIFSAGLGWIITLAPGVAYNTIKPDLSLGSRSGFATHFSGNFVKDFHAVVEAAGRASRVHEFHFAAVVAGRGAWRNGFVMCAALIAAGFGMASFRIWHCCS